jgi:PKD repeat protein
MKNTYPFSLLSGFYLLLLFFSVSLLNPNQVSASNNGGTVKRGERPPINLYSIPDQAFEQGIIRIKFNRTLENYLDHASFTKNAGGNIFFGISEIDQLNQQFGVTDVKQTFAAILQNSEFNDRHRLWGFHLWYDLVIPAGTDIRSMVMAYSSKAEIEISEPVYRKQLVSADLNLYQAPVPASGTIGLSYVPNDPRYNEQWHYNNTGQQAGTPDADIDLPEAWDITKGNNNVIVAVIDQGIEYTHTDLTANMWPTNGYNFVNNNATIIPGNHGTHVAGTVAGNTNNAIGISGIAGGSGTGNGARLMSCQVFIEGGSSGGFQNAPVWAADHGAAISQNSWGYTSVGVFDQAVLDAIDYFNVHGGGTVMTGGITIFAAGNSNSTGLWYPGCYSGCFSVAATGNQDMKAWYSNFDTWVDISAPGGETNTVADRGVLSTLLGNTYGFYQGTSMACPHVSGVAALILSLAPGLLTPVDVKNILTSTTDNISALNPTYAGKMGSGRLNAYQALLAAQAYITPVANFSATPTTVCTGNSVTFTNLTLVGTSWIWSFPGGTPSSYVGQNPPPIAYAAIGSYDVSLTVSDGTISNTKTNTGYINVKNVIADFTASATSIFEGNSVIFTDNSTCGPATWVWSFPGGTPSSFTGQTPPAIVYTSSGNYDVTLTVTKPGATDIKTKTAYITVLFPNFNMSNGIITTCGGNFYDSGGSSGNYINNENYTLTFLPGTPGAIIKATFSSLNIESGYDYLYIYNGINTSAPLIGAYTGIVSLGTIMATNPSGALTFRFTSDYIVVKPGWTASISCYTALPVADFSATSTTPTVNQTVTFTDLTTSTPTSWSWSFSPTTVTYAGGTNANSQNPQVNFTDVGIYTVTLVASNAGGTDSEIKTDYINVSASSYCIPTYNTGASGGDFISLVQLGSINNATGASASPYYTYYSGMSTDLTPGSAYTVTLSPGTYGSGNNISVWIDYNKNGIFEAFEKLGNVDIPPSPSTGTISFVVPANTNSGPTRMRVREAWADSNIDPCSFYEYGETEDYNVNILAVQYCIPTYVEGSNSGDFISLVQLGSINNASGATPDPFYTYYSSLSTSLDAGSAYTITLSPGTYGSGNNIAVWIDYNFNGAFEASEKLGVIDIPPSPATGTITFTVPGNALPGNTRMRVREVYSYNDFDPCSNYYYGETEDYNILILNSNKVLNLTVLLEGLYTGSGTMNESFNATSAHFGAGIADQITVELHNSANYSIIDYTGPSINLATNGLAYVVIPDSFSGSYYLTIRHRNSIETTSTFPVSFDNRIISYNFDNPSKAYGNNLVLKADGNYAIYSGDISQDGIVDGSDMAAVDNASTIVLTGYVAEDTNGDGLVDGSDMALIDNNATLAISAILP